MYPLNVDEVGSYPVGKYPKLLKRERCKTSHLLSPYGRLKMAKQAKAKKAVEKVVGDSKRAGYKRGSNSRINQLTDKLASRARKVIAHDAAFGNPRKPKA